MDTVDGTACLYDRKRFSQSHFSASLTDLLLFTSTVMFLPVRHPLFLGFPLAVSLLLHLSSFCSPSFPPLV
ncbi:hypothetical protein L208DRAFT_563215 [Tricholoma matsutake]|nr:hypothetical protein L208DRAFT_563215 [Tricholoma matsutake 945]